MWSGQHRHFKPWSLTTFKLNYMLLYNSGDLLLHRRCKPWCWLTDWFINNTTHIYTDIYQYQEDTGSVFSSITVALMNRAQMSCTTLLWTVAIWHWVSACKQRNNIDQHTVFDVHMYTTVSKHHKSCYAALCKVRHGHHNSSMRHKEQTTWDLGQTYFYVRRSMWKWYNVCSNISIQGHFV